MRALFVYYSIYYGPPCIIEENKVNYLNNNNNFKVSIGGCYKDLAGSWRADYLNIWT